jgi:hypothetical protein
LIRQTDTRLETLEETIYHERPVTIMRFFVTSRGLPLQHSPA